MGKIFDLIYLWAYYENHVKTKNNGLSNLRDMVINAKLIDMFNTKSNNNNKFNQNNNKFNGY